MVIYSLQPPGNLALKEFGLNCHRCGQEISPAENFCRYCGAAQENAPSPRGDDLTSEPEGGPDPSGQIQALRAAVLGLQTDIARLSQRVGALENSRPVPAPGSPRTQTTAQPTTQPATTQPVVPQPAATSASPSGTALPVAAPASAPASGLVERAAPPMAPAPGSASSTGEEPPRNESGGIATWDWEWLLGGNWLARIGIVAVVIGVGFFLKLAFDNNWIGETGRVALGLAVGVALLGGGELWQKKYPLWAQAVTGGGIAVLYLSIFAAFSLYDLVPALAALGFSFLVTLAAAGLALRYEARAIALLGILGGFATPMLLADKLPSQWALLSYVLVLDLGVLALATFRNWRWFTLLGLVGSLILFGYWHEELNPSLLLAEVGITLIFLIFIGATTLFHLIWRRAPRPLDQSLMVLNGSAYFGISYLLMFEELRIWMGGFTLLLSVFYGLLGYGILMRHREQVPLSLFAVGIALVFLTIAMPVQLGGPWISVAWAAEAVVLIWLSFNLGMRELRWFGMAVFLAFATWLLVVDTPEAFWSHRDTFFNPAIISYTFAVIATYLAAYLVWRSREKLLEWEGWLFSGFLVAGNLFLTLAVPVQASGAWIPIVWALEGVALMYLSFRLGLAELRWFSAGVFALTAVWLFAFDTIIFDGIIYLSADMESYRPIINLHFLAFAVAIGALYLSAYALWRWRDQDLFSEERFFLPAFLVAANFLTLWILSVEIIEAIDRRYFFDVAPNVAGNIISLSLSVLWAIYAAVLIVLGIVRRDRYTRLAGLGLLALPVVKLFAYDAFELEQVYRVIAFIGLGALLVIGGFLYQRYSRVIRGFLLE